MSYEEYLKRRDELLKIRTDSSDSFDKAVLSLATGSLALSIAFLDKIGAPFNRITYCLIFATWISLFGVILTNLLSYLFAKSNMDRKIQYLDDKYRDEIDSNQPSKPAVEKTFWQRTATNICNSLALVFFFISMLFFTLYIVAIHRNNYTKVLTQKKERAIMSTIKNTEVEAPVAKQIITKGKIEMTPGISSSVVTNVVTSTQRLTRGQTEAPQAIAKPTQPPASANSQKK